MSKDNQHLRISIFVVIVGAFLLLTHWVLYSALLVLLSSLPRDSEIILGIIFIILPLSFIGASVLSVKYNNFLTRVIYRLIMVWMGFFVYFFLSALLYGLAVLIFQMNGSVETFAWLGYSLLILSAISGLYGLLHAGKIKVKRVKLTGGFELPNTPASWKGRKAVWVSDLHLGQIRGKKFASKVVKILNQIRPDIIFIGGDLYDGVKGDENEIISPLKDLNPPLGAYFITGNHEEFSDATHFTRAVEAAGIKVLNHELVLIDGLQVIGITDHESIDKKKFAEILGGLNIDRTKPSIMLKHQPSGLDIAERAGINMQISGHTHKAQMFPLFYLTRLIYKGYDYGLKKFGKMNVYTSSGVGTWGPPMRVGTDGEVVVLEF